MTMKMERGSICMGEWVWECGIQRWFEREKVKVTKLLFADTVREPIAAQRFGSHDYWHLCKGV